MCSVVKRMLHTASELKERPKESNENGERKTRHNRYVLYMNEYDRRRCK